MKLKIPPAFIFLFFGLLMYLLKEFFPVGQFEFFGRQYLIKMLTFVAVAIVVVAMVQFFRRRTTVDPMRPSKATSLVTKGIYAYSRNPMYLALLLLLLAWGLWLGNAFNTLIAAGFVSYMNNFQIKPEEKALSQRFGKEYQHYCTQVRRWF
ncbi:isoprenylcysteine carboxylmethyltransferase family protein [Flavobacteriaceae bacterium 3-367]|uniref:methyltransferase family protein n=1 Tax=Eudoraea algarum TaxID=3417568 RepID=UPI003271E9E7